MLLRPWERVPNIRRYYCRFLHRVLADSFAYWWGQVLSGLVLGVAAILIAKPPGIVEAIGIALIPYGLIVILTLLVNAIRAPVKLDNHRGNRIGALRDSSKRRICQKESQHREEIQQRNQIIEERDGNVRQKEQTIAELQKPKRTAAEEHHYGIAKAALEKQGPKAITILRHMRMHEAITFSPWFAPHLPPGMDKHTAESLLEELKHDHIVDDEVTPDRTGTKTVWRIAPGMKAALDALLYEAAV